MYYKEDPKSRLARPRLLAFRPLYVFGPEMAPRFTDVTASPHKTTWNEVGYRLVHEFL